MDRTYNAIVNAATAFDINLLKSIKDDLLSEIDSYDKFFDQYLKKNSLDRRKKSKTNWEVYKTNTAEYVVLSDNLKVVEYYLEKLDV